MKKVNAKLTIPKLRTVFKYQQNATVKNTDGTTDGNTNTDPTTVTLNTVSHILGGW